MSDIRLVELVTNMPSFFSHHAVDVEYKAIATKVCSEVFARLFDADRRVKLYVFEPSKCSPCEMVSIDQG